MASSDAPDYPRDSDQRVTLAVIQRDIRDLQRTIAEFITRYDEHARENANSFRLQGERLEQVATRVAILERYSCPEKHEGRINELEGNLKVVRSQVEDINKYKWAVIGSALATIGSIAFQIIKGMP